MLQLKAENLIYFYNLNKNHLPLYRECAARKVLTGPFATLSSKFWFHGTVKRELKEPVHKQSGSLMLMSDPPVKPIELELTLLMGREEEGRAEELLWGQEVAFFFLVTVNPYPGTGRGSKGLLVLFGILGNYSEY